MKRVLLLVATLAMAVSATAQHRDMLMDESFDGTSLPEGWMADGVAQTLWMISETNYAGDAANELVFYEGNHRLGEARMVTPSFDLTGIGHLFISFKHCLDHNEGTSSLGVATSSDGGHTWHQAWNEEYGSSGNHSVCFEIQTPDMGQPDVRFCLFISGDFNSINAWYFDDVKFFSLQNIDLGIQALAVPDMVSVGQLQVSVEVFNFGIMPVNSVEATFEIDGHWPVTETFAVEIPSLGSQILTFTQFVTMEPGNYSLSVTIDQVNGITDEDAENNYRGKPIIVALGSAERFPMLEHFASSTCPGCFPFSEAMNEFCEANEGRFTYTAYQMHGPAPGDPFFTEDARLRGLFYDLQFVPRCYPDGNAQQVGPMQQSLFEQLVKKPAFMDIRGSFILDGNTITVKADLMPYVDIDAKVHVAVNEKETFGNASTSGETSFHHVMMKMLPDGNGSHFHFVACECQHLEFTFDMSSTHVEEMDDLEVAIWVQHEESPVRSGRAFAEKEILNSRFAYDYTDEHPYPVEHLEIMEPSVQKGATNEEYLTARWDAPIVGNPMGYNVFVNGDRVAENITVLSYDFPVEWGVFYVVEVQAVYYEGKTSVKQVAWERNLWSVAENSVDGCSLFPNPGHGILNIRTALQNAHVKIYDLTGKLIYNQEITDNITSINTEGWPSGSYVWKVISNGKVTESGKWIKNH